MKDKTVFVLRTEKGFLVRDRRNVVQEFETPQAAQAWAAEFPPLAGVTPVAVKASVLRFASAGIISIPTLSLRPLEDEQAVNILFTPGCWDEAL